MLSAWVSSTEAWLQIAQGIMSQTFEKVNSHRRGASESQGARPHWAVRDRRAWVTRIAITVVKPYVQTLTRYSSYGDIFFTRRGGLL